MSWPKHCSLQRASRGSAWARNMDPSNDAVSILPREDDLSGMMTAPRLRPASPQPTNVLREDNDLSGMMAVPRMRPASPRTTVLPREDDLSGMVPAPRLRPASPQPTIIEDVPIPPPPPKLRSKEPSGRSSPRTGSGTPKSSCHSSPRMSPWASPLQSPSQTAPDQRIVEEQPKQTSMQPAPGFVRRRGVSTTMSTLRQYDDLQRMSVLPKESRAALDPHPAAKVTAPDQPATAHGACTTLRLDFLEAAAVRMVDALATRL